MVEGHQSQTQKGQAMASVALVKSKPCCNVYSLECVCGFVQLWASKRLCCLIIDCYIFASDLKIESL